MRNPPWAGKLGRFRCCIYCGQNNDLFHLSSFANRCLAPTCHTPQAHPDLANVLSDNLKEQNEMAQIS